MSLANNVRYCLYSSLKPLSPSLRGGDSFSYRGELSFTYAAHYHSTLNNTLVSTVYNPRLQIVNTKEIVSRE
ncbi:hypothetical protein ccbrp13_23250 [Ktedonobacteria bacterium brp13]|nr:hypothetical protein ccbrp13_23250 [Ktedonobacteria bacterium brp13]